MMQVKWQKLAIRVVCWLASEIILGSLELDYLADYGEFLSDKNSMMLVA